MTPGSGQAQKGFRHERGAKAVLFGDRFGHELEECMTVGGYQAVVEIPIHFPLTVSVLVVVLIRAPTKLEHVIADFRDHVVTAHQRLLVVTGLAGGVGLV